MPPPLEATPVPLPVIRLLEEKKNPAPLVACAPIVLLTIGSLFVFLEYGTHDQLFPFDRVAVPMREVLERMGYPLEFRVDEGGIHWPRREFLGDALAWFLAGG